MKFEIVTTLQRYVFNPFLKLGSGYVPGTILLETTGRKSGKPRRTALAGKRETDVLWIVSEHGRRSQYVRNILANPRVRVRLGGRWRTGAAQPVDTDDPLARLRWMGGPNSVSIRLLGTSLLSVRVDLDPA